MGTPEGEQKAREYNHPRVVASARLAILGQLANPPNGFKDIIEAHVYQTRELIYKEYESWITRIRGDGGNASDLVKVLAQLQSTLGSMPVPKYLDPNYVPSESDSDDETDSDSDESEEDSDSDSDSDSD